MKIKNQELLQMLSSRQPVLPLHSRHRLYIINQKYANKCKRKVKFLKWTSGQRCALIGYCLHKTNLQWLQSNRENRTIMPMLLFQASLFHMQMFNPTASWRCIWICRLLHNTAYNVYVDFPLSHAHLPRNESETFGTWPVSRRIAALPAQVEDKLPWLKGRLYNATNVNAVNGILVDTFWY